MTDAILMVQREPMLLTMYDGDGLYPLHHAIKGHDTYNVVLAFVDEWLKFELIKTLSDMEFVHHAVKNKAPLKVISYLSSMFPYSLEKKGKKDGYTPLMYALEGEHDMDVIECVSYSYLDYVGDYDRSREYFNSHRFIVDEYIGPESIY